MTATIEEAEASTFSGVVVCETRLVGSMKHQSYRAFFPRVFEQISDLPESAEIWAYRELEKLEPGLLFRRRLQNVADRRTYFGRNLYLRKDADRRRLVEAEPRRVWPTEAERIRGFGEVYPSWFVRKSYGPRDPYWEAAAERGWKWMTARALTIDSEGLSEDIVWLPGPISFTDEKRQGDLRAFLSSINSEVIDDLSEIFDTHHLIPNDDMIVFANSQRVKGAHGSSDHRQQP